MDEAVKLASRITITKTAMVMRQAENILKHPANEYINSFIGKNLQQENPSFIGPRTSLRPRPITISQSRGGAGGTAHAAL